MTEATARVVQCPQPLRQIVRGGDRLFNHRRVGRQRGGDRGHECQGRERLGPRFVCSPLVQLLECLVVPLGPCLAATPEAGAALLAHARRTCAGQRVFIDVPTENGPADLQPLPLDYSEREKLKAGGAPHILAWYARSLTGQKYDVLKHPSFHDYACGTMASEFQGLDSMKKNPELLPPPM